MRKFADIERELHLIKFTDSRNGTLYCVPVLPGAPRLLVRHFDGDLSSSLVTAYAELMSEATAWIAADPELAALVRIEQPTEIGDDYIAHRHVNATSLDAFLEPDLDEDPPEAPPTLTRMQARFRERIKFASSHRDALLIPILRRSLLERSRKIFYVSDAEQFVIADLKPTRDELEIWRLHLSECAASAQEARARDDGGVTKYEINKYSPSLFKHGRFLREDWTACTDIGRAMLRRRER